MGATATSTRVKRVAFGPASRLEETLAGTLVGQPAAIEAIVPYVKLYQAGLSPEGRPAGVFLLLGPTGTGKTKTAETLAEALHGSEKSVLRIDCGEYQMEHEVAKLIGAPPGYLGHRETQPMLTQQRLNAVTSERSSLALVLFDEIEKAAPTMARLLLGILDKAVLRLGDNTTVSFERSLIFLTSNLGARGMLKAMAPDFGFGVGAGMPVADISRRIEGAGWSATRRKFSPEFINRIDQVITYQPLSDGALAEILDQHIEQLQRHLQTRLGPRAFAIDVPRHSRQFLLRKGASREYGARELKRTLLRHVTQPLAALVAGGQIRPGSSVCLELEEGSDSLVIRPM